MATTKPTRQNLVSRPEHDGAVQPTGRVKIFRVTEEKRARGWDVLWDTQEYLFTLDACDIANLVANLGTSLAVATQPRPIEE